MFLRANWVKSSRTVENSKLDQEVKCNDRKYISNRFDEDQFNQRVLWLKYLDKNMYFSDTMEQFVNCEERDRAVIIFSGLQSWCSEKDNRKTAPKTLNVQSIHFLTYVNKTS